VTPALRRRLLREWQPWADWDAGTVTTPPALGDLVPRVLKSVGLEQRLHQSRLCHQWASLVGPDIARHAQPVSLRNKILTVSVDHPTWHFAMRSLKAEFLAKICQRIGPQIVRDIVFRIG
jgi:predicted nucleic acid-binding Zn ribbon protein